MRMLIEDTPVQAKRVRASPMNHHTSVAFAEPVNKVLVHAARTKSLQLTSELEAMVGGALPMAQESSRRVKVDGEPFRVFELANGMCFVRHKVIHKSLLGWIENCSVAMRNSETGLISPALLQGHSQVAIKVFDLGDVKRSGKPSENAWTELAINCRLRGLAPPNVSSLLTCFRTDSAVLAVFPMFTNGDLFEYLSSLTRPLEESELRLLIQGAARSLHACHSNGICHRDVSLENFCLDEARNPFLIDFGVATEMNEQGRFIFSGPVGKAKYMAPELAVASAGASIDGRKCDVFSLGVVLLLLIVQMEPWDTTNQSDLRFRAIILDGELENVLEVWGIDLSPPLLDLLQGMLQPDPSLRLSMVDVLNHPWMLAGNADDMTNASSRPALAG